MIHPTGTIHEKTYSYLKNDSNLLKITFFSVFSIHVSKDDNVEMGAINIS